LNKLYLGTNINTFEGIQTVRVVVLNCTCDLPARAAMFRMVSFNGYYGCCFCLCKGEKKLKGSFCFPNNTIKSESACLPRSPAEVDNAYRNLSMNLTENEYGITGVPCLVALPLWHMLSSATVDYMHCEFLGVTKQLIKLWHDSKYHKEDYYIKPEGWRGMYCITQIINKIVRN